MDTLLGFIASLWIPLKIVQTVHDFDHNTNRLYRIMIKLSFWISNHNIFVSRHQAKHYSDKYHLIKTDMLSVIYNGIDIQKFSSNSSPYLRNQFEIPDNCLLLGMVSNFVPGHDHMTVCRFLKLLSNAGNEFKFLFIGKKDVRNPHIFESCFEFCAKNSLLGKCFFLGTRTDVPQILPQLDAFVYSSDHDTFGIAVIEAISSGIPVFVNDWEVMKEITMNGEKAILYETKNEKDLMNKMSAFLLNPDFFLSRARQNAEWAKQTYSIENHIMRLNHLYSSL